MSQSAQSPLARLVLFMVVLSVAGSILAGFHYYAVDLPQQQVKQPPQNQQGPLTDCYAKCYSDEDLCTRPATSLKEYDQCAETRLACTMRCDDTFREACQTCHRSCGSDTQCYDACPC